MPGKRITIFCPNCGDEWGTACIDLTSGRIYCLRCNHPFPMTPPPIPWRPALIGTTPATVIVGCIRSQALKAILVAFGDDRQTISLKEIPGLWKRIADDSISRQLRRYNATLRRLGAGFQLSYAKNAQVLVRTGIND